MSTKPTITSTFVAAWHDVVTTTNWMGKTLFLCLIGCLPILNFAITGYGLRWARDLSFGKREGLPKEVFRKGEITEGFRAAVMLTTFFIISLLVLLIAAFILWALFDEQPSSTSWPLEVLEIVMLFVVLPFVNLSIMRMEIVGYLEASLNLPRIWKAFKSAPAPAIAATVLPLFGVFIILLLFTAIGVAVLGANDFSGIQSWQVLLLAIMAIVFDMVVVFAQLLMWRALGYWAAAATPEWALQSNEADAVAFGERRNGSVGMAEMN